MTSLLNDEAAVGESPAVRPSPERRGCALLAREDRQQHVPPERQGGRERIADGTSLLANEAGRYSGGRIASSRRPWANPPPGRQGRPREDLPRDESPPGRRGRALLGRGRITPQHVPPRTTHMPPERRGARPRAHPPPPLLDEADPPPRGLLGVDLAAPPPPPPAEGIAWASTPPPLSPPRLTGCCGNDHAETPPIPSPRIPHSPALGGRCDACGQAGRKQTGRRKHEKRRTGQGAS